MTNSRVNNFPSLPSSPMADARDGRVNATNLPTTPQRNGSGPTDVEDVRGPTRSQSTTEGRRFRPELLQISDIANRGGFIARDFEQAVVDEDVDDKKSPGPASGGARDESGVGQGSHSPAVARRGTINRGPLAERPGRSRTSSSSSRSTSPPNSVEAFAEPRRRERAGTIGSRAGSETDVGHHRTVSGGTHRRRPTFSEHPLHPDILNDAASKLGASQEDVGYPNEDAFRTCSIDFEALEEFVAENAQSRAQVQDRYPRGSTAGPTRHYNEVRPGRPSVPHIVRRPASPSLEPTSSHVQPVVIDVIDEKDDSDVEGAESDLSGPPAVSELNRYNFFSSELDSTVHAADVGDLLMPGESFRDLFTLDPEGGVWWLDVLNPTDDEVNALSKAFSIHPLTSEDIKTQEAREKVELFKQYYFVCFRSFFQIDKTSEEYMEPVNVYVVVFREGALSFTFCNSPHGANVRRRIGKLRDDISNNLSSDWICYAMIDDIVDSFGPVIHEIERETDMIEDSVFVARAIDRGALLRQIGECRKKVMGLMRLLGGKADVIKGFAKRCNEQYSVTPRGEIGLYLGDIQDHLVTMMSNLSHFEMMLSRSHSNYLAQLQVDNIAQGTRANEVLSKMTVLASILVPLNLISGLFGMNVPVPGKDSEGLGWFFGILGVIVSIVFFSVCLLKRLRYF